MSDGREEALRESVRLRIGAAQNEARATEFTCGDRMDRKIAGHMQSAAKSMRETARTLDAMVSDHDRAVVRWNDSQARVQGRSR